ncbi:hypothetical protein H0A36_13710 [Endozoicomonas sp. SM1973]|uniref:Uncharacterized protein n=1 Tax=Spartinivicinus marinus TaxID=2994442 RepID=A0A853IB66_9GAMM|nr:hypothetical protein [Spartinivicinus marinus]MCX4027077.1 hypothetical protein [Spartinivicinus marinus]NYZ67071.1 hypothetical protein [Spartinivicinus marinus]
MQKLIVSTDFNGIVLFDPKVLEDFYGRKIVDGEDLFHRYMTTDEGNVVLKKGVIIPILAIDDAGYDIFIRTNTEKQCINKSNIVCQNGNYNLIIKKQAVICDLVVIKDWEYNTDWQWLDIEPGIYSVTINGFKQLNDEKNEIIAAGYEFVFTRENTSGNCSADIEKNMRVLGRE